MGASVERVLERLGIKAVLQGKNWWGESCPLPTHKNQNVKHAYKNFSIRADGNRGAGIFHCFSCQGSGRLIDLVMEVAGIEFRDAIEWIKNVEEAPAPEPIIKVSYRPMGVRKRFLLPDGVEFGPLEKWNSVARDYAVSRGLTPWQVEKWGIGYALMGRLAGRIVFPVIDSSGRLANYAARTFVDDEPRYLASSKWEAPDLAAMLGERFWPILERKKRTVVVFEGALSGMAIERAILRSGKSADLAGLQGSDIANPRRAARLATFGKVLSAADPDTAGDRVSLSLSSILRGIPFERIKYPSAKDAADTPEDELEDALAVYL